VQAQVEAFTERNSQKVLGSDLVKGVDKAKSQDCRQRQNFERGGVKTRVETGRSVRHDVGTEKRALFKQGSHKLWW